MIGLRAIPAVMKVSDGSDKDEEISPIDLFVSVPDTAVVLLKVAVREFRRRRGWRGC